MSPQDRQQDIATLPLFQLRPFPWLPPLNLGISGQAASTGRDDPRNVMLRLYTAPPPQDPMLWLRAFGAADR
jgi:hypothetical protein